MDFKKIFLKEAKPTSIGGQAVMEGIMMRSKERTALAMRLPDGEIYLKTKKLDPPGAVAKMPFVRGVVSFFYSLVEGMQVLMDSADVLEQVMPEEEYGEPGKIEKWVNSKFGPRSAWNIMLTLSVIFAIVVTLVVFVILPTWAINGMKHWTTNAIALNLLEGVLRILMFIAYVAAISKMEDIRRLFMYHGAEHKTIHCFENDQELTPENAREFYRLHPRCGTSFLMFVLIVSLLLFSFLGWPNLVWRIASRILLLPVIAGISYELLRWAGRSDNAVIRVLSYPGLLLQKLTTREPEDDQLEIAIVALKAVLKPIEEPEIEGIVDMEADLVEERHYSKRPEEEKKGKAKKDEEPEIAEPTEDIFKDVEQKRYSADISMVRNIVMNGRQRLAEAGIENARGEADDIFCYVTGFSHTDIIMRSQELLNEEDVREYEERIAKRLSGTPLQYITRVQEFWGLPFRVNENVLIPRLDTEVLAEQVLGWIRGNELERPNVLDMCTGSGILGVTIAHEIPGAAVTMADLSPDALSVAMSNAQLNEVFTHCNFVNGDLFGAVAEEAMFDLIVSNPPYIRSDVIETLDTEVKDHEPRLALDGGEDGLDIYRRIAADAGKHIKSGGLLALEIGHDQADSVAQLLADSREYKSATIIKDLNGLDRVVLAERL